MSNPDESQELRDGDPPPDTPREPGAFRRHWRLWAVVASAAIVAVAVSFLPQVFLVVPRLDPGVVGLDR